ncbi:MAG: sporulation integral membrane protein YlbJ, partial [Peptostreptococcaceae bacterium]
LEITKIVTMRKNENKGFFVLFGDAVFNGINTILMVGGFVIVFSVVFKILSIFNVINLISYIIYLPLSLFGFSKELCTSFISGLFEITIGCNQISSITNIPEIIRVSLCSFIIAFSGLSILAQCCSFLSLTDINTTIYIFSKLMHGIFAFIFTFVFYPFVDSLSLFIKQTTFSSILINNSIWIHYINNYHIILPILILIYLGFTFTLLKKLNSKTN